MSGNVFEWTADWYDENYYATPPASNPQGPESGTDRTVRGGSFYNLDYVLRCATRINGIPNYGINYVGFRVVSPGF